MKKCAVMLFLLALSMQTASFHSYASGMELVSSYSESSGIQILSEDKVVYKYRVYNGKWQRRRWNDTKKCWVDSKWTNI